MQLEASDRIGRRQQVSVDFFVGGDTPVTWARPPAQTAEVTTDKEAYAPGETATLVIQSPFQNARALAIVEEPEGRFRYDWVDIANGFGRYPVDAPQGGDAETRRAFPDHARAAAGRRDRSRPRRSIRASR